MNFWTNEKKITFLEKNKVLAVNIIPSVLNKGSVLNE